MNPLEQRPETEPEPPHDETAALGRILDDGAVGLCLSTTREQADAFGRIIELAYNERHREFDDVEFDKGTPVATSLLVPFDERIAVYVNGRLARFTRPGEDSHRALAMWAMKESTDAAARRHNPTEGNIALEQQDASELPGYTDERMRVFIKGFKTPPATANAVHAFFWMAEHRVDGGPPSSGPPGSV